MSEQEQFFIDENRWYEQLPEIKAAVEQLIAMPLPLQKIIAEGITYLMHKEFEAKTLMRSIKSLGPDVVLGLYQSKMKRRGYDQNPVMHEAMNYLSILSEENQLLVARKMLQLIRYIVEYLNTCNAFNEVPTEKDISTITTVFIEKGSEETERFLKSVEMEFDRAMKTGKDINFSGGQTSIQSQDKDMRVQSD